MAQLSHPRPVEPAMPLANLLMPSPLGSIEIRATDTAIVKIDFIDDKQPVSQSPNELCCLAAGQLTEYFHRRRQGFSLPLGATGTPFQQAVWQQLSQIPYGQTRSYGDIANQLNNPKAVRAVGAANGKNPIAIVVPCHRVIGADGSLTGYAGGTTRKAFLLALEQQGQS